MTINARSVSVARNGAALPLAAAPWASPSGAGVHSALPQNFGPVLVTANEPVVMPRWIAATAQSLAAMAPGLPTDIRKQYVHKTRVNVGGDGASGPHPEREPA